MSDTRTLIGQSLMLSFWGITDINTILDALSETRAGGVILFRANIESPQHVHELNRTLQAHARSLDIPPLLIAIDQEGGTVTRLQAPFVTVPSQMAQGATGDPEAARKAAIVTGTQLRAVGINTNFAPSLDVNNNPANPVIGTRSFGHDPQAVARFGIAALRGYHETGVIATVKHFPGHGDTVIDSHLGLPSVPHARDRLHAIELAPFVAAFRAGAPALMTAHIIFDVLDTLPATLSRSILHEFVRNELGYDGVIFTDALEMQAIAATYGPIEAARMSKAAGADVLLPMDTLEHQIAIAQALQAAVTAGRLDRSIFEATARRIARLRAAYAISYDLPPFAEPDPGLYDDALQIARTSITCVRRADRLPLPSITRLTVIDCMQHRLNAAEETLERSAILQQFVQAAFPAASCIALPAEPTDADLAQAHMFAQQAEAVLLVTRNAALTPWQARLARTLERGSAALIHAAVRGPYDATIAPYAAATLLTYGDPDVSLHALVDVLAGRVKPSGVLPVELVEAV